MDRKGKRKARRTERKDKRKAKKAGGKASASASYAEGAAKVKPEPAPGAAKKVDFNNLVVSSSTVLSPEMGLSGLQRQQMEAGIEFIGSADEAFEYTDEGQFNVEKVVCPVTGQRFERVTYYAGDTFCGYIVDVGTANVRATIEDGELVEL
ncbi:MAG TPA: hypothetical protein DCQ06_01900 [Myxococcales bacterium]|nr:hypothetical protein [Myxococcales bacterium]HAN30328.1 hypothetical protein [Myxococcales bacterium]